MSDRDLQDAAALMTAFAERTGVTFACAERRYLWTDAFAVCNFLGLARATGDTGSAALGRRVVDRVHHVLGRHRGDDPRTGWISGAAEADGDAHPTRGGLRIGKPLPERAPGEPFDERLEWDRDGQYFHYLTKWMHALDQTTRFTGEPVFNGWARELAAHAFDAFTYRDDTNVRRMYWKISIDGSRPLVASMGHQDPLDGYVTYMQLQATAASLHTAGEAPNLDGAANAFAAMIARTEFATADPLGIGGILSDAYRVAQLRREGALPDDDLLERLIGAAIDGLSGWIGRGDLAEPPTRRLAFRELGLAIGLRAAERLARDGRGIVSDTLTKALAGIAPLGGHIVDFWRDPARHAEPTWLDHRDIDEVMLATALEPDGFLTLGRPAT